MPAIYLFTFIKAPVERVFDLSRSINLHTTSMEQTNEKAIAGRSSGLIELNETVTWQAKHLFKTRVLKTKITAMSPYTSFIDEQVSGDFKTMKHVHQFEAVTGGTLMKDSFTFKAPYGLLGKAVNLLFLNRYMGQLLTKRNLVIKEYAETDKWKNVVT